MHELIQRPGDTERWARAATGAAPDWRWLQGEFVATVDFPAAMFWRDLLADSPNALVLLSTRDSANTWWESFARTIVPSLSGEVPADRPDWARRRAMNLAVLGLLTPDWRQRSAAIDAYERHNDEVRRTVAAERLIDWRPGDGWTPICSRLGLDVPTEPFPHENTAADFQARIGVTDPPTDQ
jgi:hypothetical protein